MIAVIDSNVVVAGVITGNPESPPARIVDAMIRAKAPFAVSPALIDEYRRALLYPKVVKYHQLLEPQIDRLLEDILISAVYREPDEISLALSDPGGAFLFSLLAVFEQAVLVMGDKRLSGESPERFSVLTPASFCRRLAPGVA